MKLIERLVRIATHYNKIKFSEFYKEYKHPRITDCKAMVYHAMNQNYGYKIEEIAQIFNINVSYVKSKIEHHDSEYMVINGYTKLYDNIITQYDNWSNASLDLAYSIIKTKHDHRKALKYEQILNENNRLKYENSILKNKIYKLKIKCYD